MAVRFDRLSTIFATGALIALMSATLAQAKVTDTCGSAPIAPYVPNVLEATKENMKTVKAEVVAFMATSDQYQECLFRLLNRVEPPLKDAEKKEIVDSDSKAQNEKERVGGEYNTVIEIVLKKDKPAPAAAPPTPAPAPK